MRLQRYLGDIDVKSLLTEVTSPDFRRVSLCFTLYVANQQTH